MKPRKCTKCGETRQEMFSRSTMPNHMTYCKKCAEEYRRATNSPAQSARNSKIRRSLRP